LFGGGIPAPPVLLGASGVDLFFVISGFIMYYTNRGNFGKAGAPAEFFARRVIRIVPLYWVCTLFIVATTAVGLYASKTITALSLFLSLFFLPNSNITLGVGWTLNYEMYFYAVFSFWLFFGTPRSGIIGVLASIPLMTIVGWSLPPSATRGFLGNPIAIEFCFGFALGVAFARGWISARIGRAALLVGVAGLVLGTWFGPPDGTAGLAPETRFLFWGLPAAVLLMSAFAVSEVRSRIGKVMLALGDASYSIYLTHAFVMTAYARTLKFHSVSSMPRPILMLLPILASLVVGLATYRLVELPMSGRFKIWWKRGLAPRAAVNDERPPFTAAGISPPR
jgi:peptidoglycan/LPS O-acetylase OafA/YrhL